MPPRRFIMNAGRTTKQGQQVNIGKDHAEYEAMVSTLSMNSDDMKELGIPPGGTVRVRSECGEGISCAARASSPRALFSSRTARPRAA